MIDIQELSREGKQKESRKEAPQDNEGKVGKVRVYESRAYKDEQEVVKANIAKASLKAVDPKTPTYNVEGAVQEEAREDDISEGIKATGLRDRILYQLRNSPDKLNSTSVLDFQLTYIIPQRSAIYYDSDASNVASDGREQPDVKPTGVGLKGDAI